MNISSDVAVALGLTCIAGLSTGIGSVITYVIKKPKMVYLSFSLGFCGWHHGLYLTGRTPAHGPQLRPQPHRYHRCGAWHAPHGGEPVDLVGIRVHVQPLS